MFTLRLPQANNAFQYPTIWQEETGRGLSVRLSAGEAQVLVTWLNEVVQPKEVTVEQEADVDDELTVAFFAHLDACPVCRTGVYCEAGSQMWKEWSSAGEVED